MDIRVYQSQDRDQLIQLIAAFRVDLGQLIKQDRSPDITAAEIELDYYLSHNYPIYIAIGVSGEITGYLVCRVNEDVVWVESLYVTPEHRRKGIAGKLYDAAENLASKLGGETLYNWIYPDNDAIIAFLDKRGYRVLNLIEVRRLEANKETGGKIQIGDHQFDLARKAS